MSDASEQANGRASGPVLQSVFLAVLDHSAGGTQKMRKGGQGWGRKGKKCGEAKKVRRDARTVETKGLTEI